MKEKNAVVNIQQSAQFVGHLNRLKHVFFWYLLSVNTFNLGTDASYNILGAVKSSVLRSHHKIVAN